MKEITFTTLREFKTWVNSLDESELDASTDRADWFTAYVTSPNQFGSQYFDIEYGEAGVDRVMPRD